MASGSVLITGCSAGGIGSALVESFQKHDLRVFATARTLAKMSHLEQLPNVILLTLDVTSPSSIAAAVETVRAKTGSTLDYLVNNAGASYVMPVVDIPIEDARAMFDVNFWGVLAVTQAFAPMLIAAKGGIVNISSISGYVYAPWMSIYGASKAALTTFSETLRLEMAPLGVRVVCVITGIVKTNIMANGPEMKLPSSSPYLSVEHYIAVMARGDALGERMKGSDFAKKVVRDILGGGSGKLWRGLWATRVRYITSFVPKSLLEGLNGPLLKGTGLDVFTKSSQASTLKIT